MNWCMVGLEGFAELTNMVILDLVKKWVANSQLFNLAYKSHIDKINHFYFKKKIARWMFFNWSGGYKIVTQCRYQLFSVKNAYFFFLFVAVVFNWGSPKEANRSKIGNLGLVHFLPVILKILAKNLYLLGKKSTW